MRTPSFETLLLIAIFLVNNMALQMDTPKAKKSTSHGIPVGPPGESIFYQPFWGMMDRQENELPDLFRRTADLNDHRLLALVTALIFEGRVEKLLSIYLPRYEVLKENPAEFSFSSKIKTLEALNLIPLHLTQVAHLIRNIRNEFAHDLDKTSFTEVKPKHLRKIDALLSRFPWVKPEKEDGSYFESFTAVSFLGIIGLDSYCVTLAKLRSKLQSEEFISALAREHREECDKRFKATKAKGPTSYGQNGGKWAYVFEFFVEHSDEPPEVFMMKPENGGGKINRPEQTPE